VGIVGRNGSGKSTLLKMICGTTQPTAGELTVRGRIAPMLMLGAGFSPEFTGRENAMLNATILGQTSAEIEERMESIIEFADIGEFFDQPVKSYSSGMYARLAFAVAISIDPDILVIDEVLAVGDEAFMRKCFSRIDEIKRGGATILFVSHAPNLVIEFCDRAILLERGERLLSSDPRTVISRYQKLLYGDPARRDQELRELRELDAGTTSSASDATDTGKQEDFGSYDPGLQSESTVEYERKGASILNPRILDPNGRRVNLLRGGCEYEFCYEVEFEEAAYMVRFGMMIKLITGFELAGQTSHADAERIPEVEAGTRAQVRFRFTARVVPGAYFLNAGVLGFRDGEERYLHRILDVCMFQVTEAERSDVTGMIDLTARSSSVVSLEAPRTRSARSA